MRTMLVGIHVVWLLPLGSLALDLRARATDTPSPETRGGTIIGAVRYIGTVPQPKKIVTTDGTTLQHCDLVVNPKTKGLRFVVAVIENAPTEPKLKKSEPVLVDQRDMVFLPRVIAVQHGQAVRFENNDLCNHSVMAASTMKANQFNLFVTAKEPYEHAFESQKHPIQIGCALHSWMRAWVYVLPHPWFAVSDTEGKFTINGVPPGKHVLWLRHTDTGHEDRHTVEVQAGKTAQVSIEWKDVGTKGGQGQ